MHRCLNIVEVQRAIFRQVYEQLGGSATLAGLARTCHAFNSVALDTLWAELPSLVYLIQCLPRDLWKIELGDREMTFQRPMSVRDWNIFFRYSSRVRTVGGRPGIPAPRMNLEEDVIFALSNPPAYGPLIPHLKVLYWEKPDRKHASLLRVLLTPSLITLSLSNYVLRSPEVSILTSIGTVCPSLKTLSLVMPGPFANVVDTKEKKILSEALLHLHSLKSLVCPAIDEAAFVHLSHLPLLADLSLELQVDFRLENVRPYMAPPAFASLDSLTLHANVLSTPTSLLELMQFTPRSVSIVVANTPGRDALRLFFLALVGACGSERLRRISLTTSSRVGGTPEPVTLSTFQCLLALPEVDRFELDVRCDVVLDDEAMATIAKHWPKLKTLSVNARSGWGVRSGVTHRGLIALLGGCAGLGEFALAVDFSEIDMPHTDIPETRLGKGMTSGCRVANFVTSTVRFPVGIAAFLSDVCPNLSVVDSSWDLATLRDVDEEGGYSEGWGEVESMVYAFSSVRKQCMGWVNK